MVKKKFFKWWLALLLIAIPWVFFRKSDVVLRSCMVSHWFSWEYKFLHNGDVFKPHSVILRQLSSVLEIVQKRSLQRFRRPHYRVPPEVVQRETTEELDALPRSALGFVCRDNPEVSKMGVDCKILSKTQFGFGCDKRIEDLARARNRDLNQIPPIFHSARVADACPDTCGLCDLCAPGCAKWFVGNSFCEPSCNNSRCKYDEGDCWDTNCVVGEWEEWSECSISCDPDGENGVGGVETRTRQIIRKETLNGKPCPNLVERRAGCNKGVLCPIPCEVSKWGEWSRCSSMCGPGESIRTRTVVQAPQNGAEECPELVQSRSCYISECQQECIVSEWSEWSECSKECGKGRRIRKRSVINIPIGNKTCPPLFEEEPCDGAICSNLVARMCNVTEWGEWTPCSAECGGGTQTRTRNFVVDDVTREKELGQFHATCPLRPMIQLQDCNNFACDTDCVLSEWGDWSECIGECKTAKQFRNRTILRKGEGGGVSCPESKALIQEKPCFSALCPRDCVVSPWSEWSNCIVKDTCGKGYTTRTRHVIISPLGSGARCPVLQEFNQCIIPCEYNCTLGSYTAWTSCNDACYSETAVRTGSLYSYRWNEILYYNKDCLGQKIQTKACGLYSEICGEPSEKSCLVTEWMPWEPCSKPCGRGVRRRHRRIVRQPQSSEYSCPPLVEEELCGIQNCAKNCETTEWSAWSECSESCGLGVQTRHKQILLPASTDPVGKCENLLQKRQCFGDLGDCSMARATRCEVSDWSSWSKCSASCGSFGWQYRTRQVISLHPTMHESDCPHLVEYQDCNQVPCPQPCQLSDWSSWSECSVDCGAPGLGQQVRSRQILRLPSSTLPTCPDNLKETRACLNLKPCPIPCILSDWLEWSSCSATCGVGEMHRIRLVEQQPSFGGLRCGPLKDTVNCFIKPCVTDCVMSAWGPFTECSEKCGGGTRQRRREVIVKPSNGGKPCSALVEYEECNTFPCSEYNAEPEEECIVSEWSSWSSCPVKCGGGVQIRSRTVLSNGPPGSICPNLEERRGCGLSRCKMEVDCRDRLDVLEAFKINCNILLAQGCDRNLKELAESQGLKYPEENPPEARVKDVCPLTCNVCQECSPGCQLRDKGNTVCDEECNNEACDFDLGDCGKDCSLPSPLLRGLRIIPEATGIDVGERVELVCRKKTERFQAAPQFSRAFLSCADASSLTLSNLDEVLRSVESPFPLNDVSTRSSQFTLKLEPENLYFSFLHSPFVLEKLSNKILKENVHDSHSVLGSIFQCAKDLCPYVSIEGIIEENLVFSSGMQRSTSLEDVVKDLNGIYERTESDLGLPFYKQGTSHFNPSAKKYILGARISDSKYRSLEGIVPLVEHDKSKLPFLNLLHPKHGNPGNKINDHDVLRSRRRLQFQKTKGSLRWYIIPERLYSDNKTLDSYISSTTGFENEFENEFRILMTSSPKSCGLPPLGQYIEFKDCIEPTWVLHTTKGRVTVENVTVSCITERQRDKILKSLGTRRPPTILPRIENAMPETGDSHPTQRPSVYEGQYVTYNIFTDPEHPEMMFCEDRPEVEAISNRSCKELNDILGCGFLLSESGMNLPQSLPITATLAAVCPETCNQCTECFTGCFLWFLGNGYCDPACNRSECEFDRGDCQKSGTMDLMTSKAKSNPSNETCILDMNKLPWFDYGISMPCSELLSQLQVSNPTQSLDDFCDMPINQFILSVLDLHSIKFATDQEHNLLMERLSDLADKEDENYTKYVKDLCRLECHMECFSSTASSLDLNALSRRLPDLSEDIPTKEPNDDDLCEDDPLVKEMNYTCTLLKAVAQSRLHKGCEAPLTELLALENITISEMPNKNFLKMTRVIDACPKTCGCCSCLRFRRPRVPKKGIWRVKSTLGTGEHPNCIHDTRIEQSTALSCFEIVDSLRGQCSIKLADLAKDMVPSEFPESLTLGDACGVACGKCPLCEDSFLVEQRSGFTCSQIVEMHDNNCDILLETLLGEKLAGFAMVQLKHVCPKSCGMCDAPHAYSQALYVDQENQPLDLNKERQRLQDTEYETCQDHTNIATGVTCDTLYQYSNQDCQRTLQSMGVDFDTLPTDLHPLLSISEVCPRTCSACATTRTMAGERQCVDNPIVEQMNQTCALLVQVGNRGCNTLLKDFGTSRIPDNVPKRLRVKDLCRFTCGLCSKPTCSDNFQNGKEEGVDCGGPCRPCRSCSSRPLKALGPAYIIEGLGTHHGANRTLYCQKNYVRESGSQPGIIYCDDGLFTKTSLVCGEKKQKVLRSSIRILSHDQLNAKFLPALYLSFLDFFSNGISENEDEEAYEDMSKSQKSYVDLRFLRAGDCNELVNLGKFVCQDNPEVKRTGYDCSILSRLGCSKLFAELAREHNTELPPEVPQNSTVGDACPVTCRTCDALKRKMNQLKVSQYASEFQEEHFLRPEKSKSNHCLQVDFVVADTKSFLPEYRSLFHKRNLHQTSIGLSKSLKRQLNAQSLPHEVSLMLDEFETVPLAVSHWRTLYTIPLKQRKHLSKQTFFEQAASEARHIFIAPGIPMPVFDPAFVPEQLQLHDIIGQMYRPIVGVGEEAIPEPTQNGGGSVYFFGDRGGIVTGWYDSSGSASVVSPIVRTVADICQKQFALNPQQDNPHTCCFLKNRFEKFLMGPCGSQLYDRVVSDQDLQDFCLKRTVQVNNPSSGFEGNISCYETALRLVESFKHRPDPTCLLVQYVEQLVHAWCAKDSLDEFLKSHESVRDSKKFCFPLLKQTLQKRFDLLYMSSFSDEEMSDMCKSNSCTRHHLRYIDALTQIQLAWIFSSLHTGLDPFSLFVHTSDAQELTQFTEEKTVDPISYNQTDLASFRYRQLEPSVFSSQKFLSYLLKHFRLKNTSTHSKLLYKRNLYMLISQQGLGSYITDFPELFLNFVCFQVNGQFCQHTLLLFIDEDFIHNPASLSEPCKSPCFIPMIHILGGHVESFGERQNHPYYKSLGSVLRSYGRFYCTVNSKGDTCGSLLFKNPSPLIPSEGTPLLFSLSHASQQAVNISLDVLTSNVSTSKGCSPSFINDGQCDAKCFAEDSLWDGHDCRIANMVPEQLSMLKSILSPLILNAQQSTGETHVPSCLFYDALFTCSNPCFALYKQLSESLGCCFTAALESFASLLRIEMQHPSAKRVASWVADRSIDWLEQSCHCTIERTCRVATRYGATWRFDVILSNTVIRSRSNGLEIGLESEEAKSILILLQHTLAQFLHIGDFDITRLNIRRDLNKDPWVEVFVNSEPSISQIEKFFSDSDQQKLLEKIIQRRLTSLDFTFEPRSLADKFHPNIKVGLPNSPVGQKIPGRSRNVPFSVTQPLPLKGTLGFPGWNQNLLRNESCSRDFQEIGMGYRILRSGSLDVQHGATRSLRCSKNYYSTHNELFTDTLICDNGRWIKLYGLQCFQRCSLNDLWRKRSRDAYQILNEESVPEWFSHGSSVLLSCAANYTPSRGFSVNTAICNDGTWNQSPLTCKHNCEPFRPPEPVDGYSFNEPTTGPIYHGTKFAVSCRPGYFSLSYRVEETNHSITQCDDGKWLPLGFRCVKPNKVLVPKSPTLMSYMLHQFFTGVGMIGFLIGLGIVFFLITIIALSWVFYFKRIAKRNAKEHKQILHDALDIATTHDTTQSVDYVNPGGTPSIYPSKHQDTKL